VSVSRLVRLAILAAVLSACSGGSDATSRSDSTSTPSSTSSATSTPSANSTPQQGAVVIFGNATSFEDAVGGRLMDGRPFFVRHDPVHTLCLTIGDQDFGCDDEGPVVPRDRDPTTARFAVERYADGAEGASLAYGYLPENATGVVAVLDDGRRVDDEVVSKGAPRVWALPLPAGVKPFGFPPISYVAADGAETPARKI
jgi:hypothetical protein